MQQVGHVAAVFGDSAPLLQTKRLDFRLRLRQPVARAHHQQIRVGAQAQNLAENVDQERMVLLRGKSPDVPHNESVFRNFKFRPHLRARPEGLVLRKINPVIQHNRIGHMEGLVGLAPHSVMERNEAHMTVFCQPLRGQKIQPRLRRFSIPQDPRRANQHHQHCGVFDLGQCHHVTGSQPEFLGSGFFQAVIVYIQQCTSGSDS